MTKKKRLFSGMQPTGALHIGNYLGALKQWVALMDEYECFYCIVDYHAITIPYQTKDLQTRILEAATDYLAGGLDPERCHIFVQSHVPQHTELAWIFNAVTPIGQLLRMTQFKQKSRQFSEEKATKEAGYLEDVELDEAEDDSPEEQARVALLRSMGRINTGLQNYPVLQAADILLYKGQIVPVGADQVQHIELTRDIARRFNNRFKKVFPACEALLSETAPRVMGLDGVNKMSKSIGNHIPLTLTAKQVEKKVTREAASDPRRVQLTDPGVPEECNVYEWHKLFSTQEEQKWAAEGCRTAGIGCYHCKKQVADNINAILEPIRERREAFHKDQDYVKDVLAEGAKKAESVAAATMEQVHEVMGLRPKRKKRSA